MPRDEFGRDPQIKRGDRVEVCPAREGAFIGTFRGYVLDSREDLQAIVEVDGKELLRSYHPSRIAVTTTPR